jgi:hypothetical protein
MGLTPGVAELKRFVHKAAALIVADAGRTVAV